MMEKFSTEEACRIMILARGIKHEAIPMPIHSEETGEILYWIIYYI